MMKVPYSSYGYPTLIDLFPTAIEENMVREALELHKGALASFIVERPHFHKRRYVIGSGFFVFSSDPSTVLLFSAAHVVEKFEESGYGWITVGAKMIAIGDVGVRKIDRSRDFAIWEIPSNLLISYGIEGVESVPLLSSEQQEDLFLPTCSFAVFGYPGSKNSKIDMRDGGSKERYLTGIALHGFGLDQESKELCFYYSGAGVTEAWSKKITTTPPLDGMSGSPCFRFAIHKQQKQPALVLAGVFTRRVLSKPEIRAIAFDSPWLPVV